jgi:hypothetical protein
MLIGSSPIVAEVIVDLSGETVEGSLLDNDRKPVTLTRVVLVPEPARRQNHSLYKTALTDLSGRFVIRGVAPGAYKVFGWNPSPPMNAHMNQEFLSRYEDRGQAVQVTQGFSGRVNVWVIDR